MLRATNVRLTRKAAGSASDMGASPPKDAMTGKSPHP